MTGIGRLVLLYAFIVVVGVLGGRIGAAAWMYTELGWTATWLEISSWGQTDEPVRMLRAHGLSRS